MQNSQKAWQVQVQGQIYEADLEELRQWITEGSVLPSDNIRRGDLRWLPAEKVPALYKFFGSEALSAGDSKPSGEEVHSITRSDSDDSSALSLERASGDSAAEDGKIAVKPDENFCCRHTETPTAYACDICESFFCKSCPKSFGGSVKLCPLCGSLCREIGEPVKVQNLIGSIHKPYTQADESDSAEDSRSGLKTPGFWKSLACSLKYYKNSIRRTFRR